MLCLSISPTIRSFHSKNDVSLFRKITRFIVGKSIKALKCVRPYSEDEDSNIVRISTDNMKVLGLDDTGKVVITYGMQSVLCKALPYENEERLLKTNKDINVETSIGIPINLRKKLGICKLNVSVKVERDTNSIFKARISKSLLSSLLTMYGAIMTFYENMHIAIIITMIAIPIIIYIMFAEQREKSWLK